MRFIRMLGVRDEADILQRNLDWYAEAGFETVVVDTGSIDGSFEICQRALDEGKVVALERMPTERHDIRRVVAAVFELARRQRPDALLLTAPDEFFEVADGGDLRAAIEEDFAAGYNVIELREMVFVMTRRDDPDDPDPLSRMRYYSFRRDPVQRAYPCIDGLDLVSGRSHRAVFPANVEARISPRVYVSRHYPLRTVEQALRKLRRFEFHPEDPKRSSHYLHYSGDSAELFVKAKYVTRYRDDHRWDFTERLEPARAKLLSKALLRAHIRTAELERANRELRKRHAALERELEALRAKLEAESGAVGRES
jgi:glycosyltransferase involved in cell wall biosynthesis